MQFPEDVIHTAKVKLHTLKHMTASERCCGAAGTALAANGNTCVQPRALTSTLTPSEEKEGEKENSWDFVSSFQLTV